jgi:hypothetical protein
VTPLSAERFGLQFTIGSATLDKLRYVQELLSHRLPPGELPQVFDLALDALVAQLELEKLAATARPRPCGRRPSADPRHIPADVKRAVWQRDRGRCTFVGERGQRCGSRKFLETLWNDGLAVVTSGCLREEKPTVVARGHLRSRVSTSGARAAYERSPS